MLSIVNDSAYGLYSEVCKALIVAPKVVTRGFTTKELIDVHFELTKPRARIVTQHNRNMNLRYWIGELCFFLDGRTDLASISYYSKFWNKVSDDGKTINSAYGYRLFKQVNMHNYTQLVYIIDILMKDPFSRKAVMPIYNFNDARISNDNPCTMFLQFIIRNDTLQCYTFMRSNDIWLGFPYDIAFFTLVQEIVYMQLLRTYPDLQLGSYYHNVISLHVYENNFEAIEKCAYEQDLSTFTTPALVFNDVDNWFNDLLTFEKAQRGVVLYKNSGFKTRFQEWAKDQLIS